MSSRNQQLSPRGRLIVGLLCVALGLFPFLAAFDIGPLHRRDINGPPWLGAVAGGMFILSGLAVAAGEERHDHPLFHLITLAMVAGLAAMANWIAFGPGPRQCSGGFTAFLFTSTRQAAEFECRLAFGIAAGLMDGLLAWVLARSLRKYLGPGLFPDALEKFAKGVLLLALAPILIPLVLVLLAKALAVALVEYLRTGRWPRNEAFIARRKTGKPPTEN